MAEKSTAEHLAETILPGASLGTLGTDLFFDLAPDEKPVDVAIAVVKNAGGPDPAKNAHRTHYSPTIQIVVYGPPEDWTTTWNKAEDIRKWIVETFTPTVVDATKYTGVYQRGDMFSLGPDENKRPRVTMNFEFKRQAYIAPLVDTLTEALVTQIYNHTSDSGHGYLYIPSANHVLIYNNEANANGVFSMAVCDSDFGNSLNGILKFQAVYIPPTTTLSAILRYKDQTDPGYLLRYLATQVTIYRNGALKTVIPITPSIINGEYIQTEMRGDTIYITIDPGGVNERTYNWTDPTPIVGQYKAGFRCDSNTCKCDNLTYTPTV